MTITIQIKKKDLDQIIAHCKKQAPLEACGFLAGNGSVSKKVFLIENELQSPTRFRMLPRQQLKALLDIEALELDLLAIFHSHPQGPPTPSMIDIQEISFSGPLQIIVSFVDGKWAMRAFEIKDYSFIEIAFTIIYSE